MNKHTKLSICLIALEALNESSDSFSEEEEERDYPLLPIQARPRIKNYIDVITEYSDAEFKSHFR